MLRFILAILLMMVLFKITQDNAYIGFGLWLFMAVTFMTYTINSVDCEDVEFERELLKTPEGRRRYYEIINSQ